MTNNELDTLMAVEVMKYERVTASSYGYDEPIVSTGNWSPTTDLNQAMECYNKIKYDRAYDFFYCELVHLGNGYWCFRNHTDEGLSCEKEISATDESAPLAICKAILKAKGIEIE